MYDDLYSGVLITITCYSKDQAYAVGAAMVIADCQNIRRKTLQHFNGDTWQVEDYYIVYCRKDYIEDRSASIKTDPAKDQEQLDRIQAALLKYGSSFNNKPSKEIATNQGF